MPGAAGQVPDEPTVHGAESQLTMLRPGSRAWDVVENPSHLGRGKIRVQHKARAVGDVFTDAALLQGLALCGCTPVLPHDGGRDGLAGGAVPDNYRLALVGDADGGDVAGARAGPAQRVDSAGELAGEDLHGVVLDPTRLRVELLKLMLCHGGNRSDRVKQDCAGTGCPLIKCKDVSHLFRSPSGYSQTRAAGGGQGTGNDGVEFVEIYLARHLPRTLGLNYTKFSYSCHLIQFIRPINLLKVVIDDFQRRCPQEHPAGAKAQWILLACPAGDLLYISDRAPGLHIGPCFEVLIFMLVVIGAGGNLGISILRFPD